MAKCTMKLTDVASFGNKDAFVGNLLFFGSRLFGGLLLITLISPT